MFSHIFSHMFSHEVLTAVLMRIQVFWDVTLWPSGSRRCNGNSPAILKVQAVFAIRWETHNDRTSHPHSSRKISNRIAHCVRMRYAFVWFDGRPTGNPLEKSVAVFGRTKLLSWSRHKNCCTHSKIVRQIPNFKRKFLQMSMNRA